MNTIRLPNICSDTVEGKLEQICAYLYALSAHLNFALGGLEAHAPKFQAKAPSGAQTASEQESRAAFDSLKGLIIKSADIVNAYYESIHKRLVANYEALSDYGSFKKQTETELIAAADELKLLFEQSESLHSHLTDLEGVLQTEGQQTLLRSSAAYLKVGMLSQTGENGFPLYGMEIGQRDSENGEQTDRKLARYCSDGVHLFDEAGTEVVTVTGGQLRCPGLQITDTLQIGNTLLKAQDGIAFYVI